jgi:hypothetical protein
LSLLQQVSLVRPKLLFVVIAVFHLIFLFTSYACLRCSIPSHLTTSPQFVEFFVRDITEQSSRYLKRGTFEYADTGATFSFPPSAPTTQLFLRGNFESLTLSLYGRVAAEYVLPAKPSSLTSKPTGPDDARVAQSTAPKSASIATLATTKSHTPLVAAKDTEKGRDRKKEQREQEQREAEMRERQRQDDCAAMKTLHARLPPITFSLYSVLGEGAMREDGGDGQARNDATRRLQSSLFARKGCLGRCLSARESQDTIVARFLDLCIGLRDAWQEFSTSAGGKEGEEERERLEKTLDGLKAIEMDDLERMLITILD